MSPPEKVKNGSFVIYNYLIFNTKHTKFTKLEFFKWAHKLYLCFKCFNVTN